MSVRMGTLSKVAILAMGLALLALCMSSPAMAKGYIFITCQQGYMHMIDASNYALLNTFSVSDNRHMAADPGGDWLYLAGNKNITLFNTTTFARGTSIPYTRPTESVADVIMGADGRMFIATDGRYILTFEVDESRTVPGVAVFMTGNPYKLEISPDKSRLYVAACLGSGNLGAHYTNDYNISVYDTARLGHIKTRRLNMTVEGLVANPDGNSLYVLGHNSSTGSKNTKVLKLRASDLATLQTTYGGGRTPKDVLISPDGDRLYVAEHDNDTILVFDADTLALEKSVNVGDLPYRLSISPNGKKLYIASTNDEFIVMDTDTYRVTRVATGDYGNPIDIDYVDTGGPSTFLWANLSLLTITPVPTPVPISDPTTLPAAPSASSTPSSPAATPGPSASTDPASAAASVTPSPAASPGASSTAPASPAGVSTPGFDGSVSILSIALAATALIGWRRPRK